MATRQDNAEAPRPPRAAAAFTVPELLLSLALTGAILAATAVAMQGVFMSYSENEDIADVTQAARVVLQRMMKEVRTADGISSAANSISIIPPSNPEDVEEIEYELAGDTLFYRRTVNSQTTSVPLLTSTGEVRILGLEVSRETGIDEGVVYTKRLTATLTLRAGANPLVITASACPRRNLAY